MEKINEIKAMLDDMGKDLEKFYSKGQNSAGTRLRKSLNEVRKKCQEMRNEIQTIRQDRKSSAPAS
ncbi:MAG TPA: histone H1 [Ignavibacteria bacterium]|nr:histone H1 [Ignavibacteria bacterium]HMQ80711.1 histone H1 [Ignavibacteria bacterium]HMR00452.1 histone H1 [Ignavibacteria bacterium]HWA04910.1 histone H1 [Ignavibacteria bacterium]